MEYISVSSIKRMWDERQRHLFRIAVIVMMTGAIAVFSGFLHYVSVSLPVPLTMFCLGVWISASFFLALA